MIARLKIDCKTRPKEKFGEGMTLHRPMNELAKIAEDEKIPFDDLFESISLTARL